jgi:aromatic-L-amino-acid/L-tryptophan decarboxylase
MTYASAAHMCNGRAPDMAGLGSAALCSIRPNGWGGIDVGALRVAIRADRDQGFQPFLVIGMAGSVDTGTIDVLLH